MKKTFFLLVLFLFTIQINAQENTATKEETMEWIAGKFKDILVSPRKFHSYNSGVFTYYGTDGKTLIMLDLKNVSNVKDFYMLDYKLADKRMLILEGKNLVNFTDGSPSEDYFQEWEQEEGYDKQILDIDKVTGLRGRLIKSFTRLLELNIGKKDNEKF
ncbi:hypothetical protein J2X97_001343 [Epilithonimonas hungarica]|uniref:hypothetical protein n=1 Tax=Epilithonimonas hungarica TaxID=454006 RepID=UPI0027808C35|nr:hypothetical protein [Epilithonimonas hungarica]MDP9955706.1 hypothetical protein [Epilithonimonas hungarica]